MQRLIVFFFFVLLMLLGMYKTAEANPLLRTKEASAPAQQVEKKSDEAPSLFSKAWFKLMYYQKAINAKITKQMRLIKEGNHIALLWALGLAFVYGMIHSIGPGHGKVIISSYYMGNDAKKSHAPVMALSFAVTHSISAIIVVWSVDKISSFMLGKPSAEVTAVKLISYAMIFAIGLYMLYVAIKNKQLNHHHHSKDNEKESMELEDDVEDACRSMGACCSHYVNLEHISERPNFLAFVTGLAPCAGALLVMIYAMANGIVMTGIMVVVAITLGMATTLTVVGLIVIVSRQKIMSMFDGHSKLYSNTGRIAKAISALFIMLVGAVMFYEALR